MAGKKPAKPMAGQSKQVVQDPAIYGAPLMFIGGKSASCACNKCGKLTVRGMVRVKNDAYYCSAGCASRS
jgi:hypothetical protein